MSLHFTRAHLHWIRPWCMYILGAVPSSFCVTFVAAGLRELLVDNLTIADLPRTLRQWAPCSSARYLTTSKWPLQKEARIEGFSDDAAARIPRSPDHHHHHHHQSPCMHACRHACICMHMYAYACICMHTVIVYACICMHHVLHNYTYLPDRFLQWFDWFLQWFHWFLQWFHWFVRVYLIGSIGCCIGFTCSFAGSFIGFIGSCLDPLWPWPWQGQWP